ncbi:MAG: NAD(P)H dehydrogenase [Candidatus Muiribacterium halophilum]|uniref:NAD(P)H dehydrogenase n=1 Tax=Muiribacterium halophilum TaxID=2053465 RepID=A0A2N5ZHD6_MUIH1|nr:MAG: NAD(P)H dehydrogenase [Candidatus Muirbacterium halophilum]
MNSLIIYAHPNPKSFNHAILENLEKTLLDKGNSIKIRDLYSLGFNPILAAKDFEEFIKGNIPADIKIEQNNIDWADHIFFIFPIWWFGMPAILKGFIDRVFSNGFAYKYTEKGPVGLLNDKVATIINTTGGNKEQYIENKFKEAIDITNDIGKLAFCGIKVIEHKYFYGVPMVSDGIRKEYLEEINDIKV